MTTRTAYVPYCLISTLQFVISHEDSASWMKRYSPMLFSGATKDLREASKKHTGSLQSAIRMEDPFEGVAALAAGEQITLKTKATKWSPYADYGFDVVIGDGTAEGCTLSMDGSAVEQALRGQ